MSQSYRVNVFDLNDEQLIELSVRADLECGVHQVLATIHIDVFQSIKSTIRCEAKTVYENAVELYVPR